MPGISKTNAKNNREQPVANRVALVTGGRRGIGRAIAIKLAELGAAVAICGRDSEKLRATAGELDARSGRSFWQTADVTRVDEVGKLVSETEAKLWHIEIIVNKAGIGLFGPAHEKIESSWDRRLHTNANDVVVNAQ